MQRCQPRGAERAVLLLGMLENEKRYPVVDRHDGVAHAERRRLVTARAIGASRAHGLIVHVLPIRSRQGGFNGSAAAFGLRRRNSSLSIRPTFFVVAGRALPDLDEL